MGKWIVSMVVLGGLVLASCQSAAPAAPTPSQPASASKPAAATGSQPSGSLTTLVDGARKETTIKAMWSEAELGGSAGFQTMVQALNQKHGLNLTAQFTPGPPQNVLLQRLTQEAAAGQPASTDLYAGSSPNIIDAAKANVLKKMDWRSVVQRPAPSDASWEREAPDGVAEAISATVVGIPYNTNLVKGDDIPQTLEDVLKPKWQGKIASTPYATGLYEFAAPEGVGYDTMKDFTTRLTRQVGGLIRCGEENRVASGEFAMLVFDCGGNQTQRLADTGAPIAHTPVKEVTRLNVSYIGIPTNSAAPNAAALLVDYLESPEGQALLWQLDRKDLPLYPDSQTYARVQQIRQRGTKIIVNTVQYDQGRAAEVDRLSKEFIGILNAPR